MSTPEMLAAADQVELDLEALDVSTRALLTVLRAGDGAFSPPKIAGLRLWLDAADTTTITDAGAGAVSQWTSKDANARVFTQATAGLRPTTNASTRNARNVIDFAGDWLGNTAAASVWKFLTDGTIHHVFAVVKFGTVADPNARYDLLGVGNISDALVHANILFDDRASLTRNDRIVYRAANGTATVAFNLSADNAFAANTWGLLQVKGDIGNATAADRVETFVNGGAAIKNNAGTATPSASNPANTLHVGVEFSVTPVFPLTGQIAELLIYEADLTADDVAAIESYLAAKWALTL